MDRTPAKARRCRHLVAALLFVLALAGALALTAPWPVAAGAPGSPVRPPTIQWSTRLLNETVTRGSNVTVPLSFFSTSNLADVVVVVDAPLAPYVSVSPSTFALIPGGANVSVILTLSGPARGKAAAVGTLRLRQGGNSKKIYPEPLHVSLRFTANRPPIADAGADQTGAEVGDVVRLDGSGSSDPDGQPLRYSWALTTVPPGSTAELSDPAVVNPAFIPDQPGTYVARLTVSDGIASSAPDEVSITVVLPPPTVVITAPENLTVVSNSPVTVTGTVDDPNATLTVNGTPTTNNAGTYTAAVALVEGGNTVTVVAQNATGQGEASVDVILNTTENPAVRITSPGSGFVVGEEFALGVSLSPPPPVNVAVSGVVKVNTLPPILHPFDNQPTVTVNGVAANVTHDLLFTACGLLDLLFQCWEFTATIPLVQGSRTVTASATDRFGRTSTASVGGIVDYCRIGDYFAGPETPGNDPGVVALAGVNHAIQSNRCHEIDGCSVPLPEILPPFLRNVGLECVNDPMQCPIPVIPGVIPARFNVASTAFGRGTVPPDEHFVHGRESAFARPCNRHDVCYQTCVDVGGASDPEPAWALAWTICNVNQYRDMLDVCNRAYPARCPFHIPGTSIPNPLICPSWFLEKATCTDLATAYFAGVQSDSGFDAFVDRQQEYCAVLTP